jgi:hypothetical protein
MELTPFQPSSKGRSIDDTTHPQTNPVFALLEHILASHGSPPPPAAPASRPPSSSEPVAGPSRVTADARTPSSAKGKRRADLRDDDDGDGQTAAQLAADAALAAALQAEEDGVEARRLADGLVIR